MVRVRLRLLGTVSVEIDGEPVDLPSGRATELLAWLAAHPGHHPRGRVASLFWPDVADATARASLRTALWAIRKALGPRGEAVLVLDRNTVGLEGPGLRVDLRERSAWSLDEAIAADLDNVLPGIESEWADQVRADHRAAVIALLANAHDRAEADGDAETCLRAARRLTEIDPLSEEHHRLLLRRLAAADERAAAKREHESFRRRLWNELGVRPSRTTVDLAQRVLSAGEGRHAGRVPNRLARLQRELMVGRDDEWDHLVEEWRACRGSGEARVVLLDGEAGIGKTRLLAECAARVREDGGCVLFGTASQDELLPAEPFLEAIGHHQNLDPDGLIEVIRGALEVAAAEGPVALLLDDFQWADSVSFAILRRLVRHPVPTGMAVIVAYRTESEPDPKLTRLVTDVSRDAPVVRISLAPLSLESTSSLVADLDSRGLLRDRVTSIHRDTRGNPFFVRELGRYLVEHPSAPELGPAVPDTIRDLVAAKLETLSPLGAEAVSIAAVVGSRVELPVLRHTLSGGAVLDALEEAVANGLMEEEGAGVHAFRHALVRNAVYELLSKSRRAEFHRRAADALRAIHGEAEGVHLCDIAEHRCAASPPDSPSAAAADARRAARWAIDHHVHDRAVVVLTKALQVCEPSARQELAVLRAIAYQRLTHDVIDPIPT